MRIVGIDTSAATASVALLEDGRLVAERCHPDSTAGNAAGSTSFKSNHAEILLPLIESVVRQARITIPEVSGIALSIGPGSFTGLRIGLSTVKGLAYGWRIPVVGISTLLAQAARASDFDGLICALLDARKNEVYVALFRKRGQELARLTEDLLVPVGSVIDQVRGAAGDMPCLFIGDGARRYEKLLLDALGGRARLCEENSVSSCAAAVARLGMERMRRSEADDLGELVPVYLRPSEAEAKRSNVTDGEFAANSTLR
jgi:tRNA threonylcarbamoyladenosine biosynthesis protein TsaB